ncbi:MAG: hypothetical protein HeimC3_21340 [Candidatus Heimdallarchaeota archaeon LC_3]|nr:MAG: hypothetical protein HeimC3_21340 [Candidatus Heimdallarchaeota archaeon LC_3]
MNLSFSESIINSAPKFDLLMNTAKFKELLVICENLLSNKQLNEPGILFLSIAKSWDLVIDEIDFRFIISLRIRFRNVTTKFHC